MIHRIDLGGKDQIKPGYVCALRAAGGKADQLEIVYRG